MQMQKEPDHMEELTHDTESVDYEALCHLIYAYRFGAIGFMELLGTFERILGIVSDPPIPDQTREA